MFTRAKILSSLTAAVVGLSCSGLGAETVYKHVDQEGNVTYSSEPIPVESGETLVSLEVEPRITEEQRETALRRQEGLEWTLDRLEAERQREEEERAERVAAAEGELRDARAALQEAKKRRVEDWQHLVSGGRVLKPRYFERVEAAEQRVLEAKASLRDAGGQVPPP